MEDQLIKDYHILILGALKKCHVTAQDQLFEDYLQIARLVLIDTHRSFKKENRCMDAFHNYVYQRICWKITDEIRKESTYNKRLHSNEDEDLLLELVDPHQEDLLEINDLLKKCYPTLSKKEQTFLTEAYIDGLSIIEIAQKHQVSRQSVYKLRHSVSIKILIFFEK